MSGGGSIPLSDDPGCDGRCDTPTGMPWAPYEYTPEPCCPVHGDSAVLAQIAARNAR